MASKDMGGEGRGPGAPTGPSRPPGWRAPLAETLPRLGFADADWFAGRLGLTPQLVREVHDRRAAVRALSGFPWPEARPSQLELGAMFAAGYRWPMFVRAVSRVACSTIRNERKRSEFSPFPQRSKALVRAMVAVHPPGAVVTYGPETLLLLDQAGREDEVRESLVLFSVTNGLPDGVLDAARSLACGISDLLPFLEASAAALDGCDFDWDRDCRLIPCAQPGGVDRAAQGPRTGSLAPGGGVRDAGGAPRAGHAAARAEEPPSPPGDQEAQTVPGASVAEADHPSLAPGDGGPLPGQDPGSMAARARWEQGLEEITRVAMRVGRADPDPRALSSIVPLLRRARAAARQWEDANPPLVDAAPIRDEISRLAAAMAPLAGEGAQVPDVASREAMATPDAARLAEADLAAARAMAEEAEVERAAALELMARGDLGLLAKVNAHARLASERSLAALARLRCAASRVSARPGQGASSNGRRRIAAVSAPGRGDAWWTLPGPERYVAAAAGGALAAGAGLALLDLPRRTPKGLMAAVSSMVEGRHGASAIRVDAAWAAGATPAETIAQACGLPPEAAGEERLVGEPSLGWCVLLIEGIDAAGWPRWREALARWAGFRARLERPGLPGLVVELPAGVASDAEAATGARALRWMERVSRVDTQCFVERLMGWPGSSLVDRVAVSVAVELAAWDRELAEFLATLNCDTLLEPLRVLRNLTDGHEWPGGGWEEGACDFWEGRLRKHTLALLASGEGEEVRLRLWRAHVREVFPFLDDVRSAFLRKHRPALEGALPFTKWSSGRQITYSSIEHFEFAEMGVALRGELGEREAGLIQDAHQLRCLVAHFTPAPRDLVRRVSDLWEDLSDGSDLHPGRA